MLGTLIGHFLVLPQEGPECSPLCWRLGVHVAAIPPPPAVLHHTDGDGLLSRKALWELAGTARQRSAPFTVQAAADGQLGQPREGRGRTPSRRPHWEGAASSIPVPQPQSRRLHTSRYMQKARPTEIDGGVAMVTQHTATPADAVPSAPRCWCQHGSWMRGSPGRRADRPRPAPPPCLLPELPVPPHCLLRVLAPGRGGVGTWEHIQVAGSRAQRRSPGAASAPDPRTICTQPTCSGAGKHVAGLLAQRPLTGCQNGCTEVPSEAQGGDRACRGLVNLTSCQ